MIRRKVKQHTGRIEPYSATILGIVASKANNRKIANFNGVSRIIKSKTALSFLRAFQYQAKRLVPMFEDDVCVTMKIFYPTRRNDLDESLILDALQGYVYANDRQVREKHIYWGLDASNPRVEFTVSCILAEAEARAA